VKLASESNWRSRYPARPAGTLVKPGLPAMHHIDSSEELADNRRNQVNNRVDQRGSAGQERNLNFARLAPFEAVGKVADSKMLGGKVSV